LPGRKALRGCLFQLRLGKLASFLSSGIEPRASRGPAAAIAGILVTLQAEWRLAVIDDNCGATSQSASASSSSSSSLSRLTQQQQQQQQPLVTVATDPLYHRLLRVKIDAATRLRTWSVTGNELILCI